MWLNDSSGRRTCARSPRTWACARPSSAARTSSSTPTRCAASCATAGVDRRRRGGRGRAGPRVADPGAAATSRAGSSRSRSTRSLAGALPATIADRRPRPGRPARGGARRRAARRRELPGPPPTALVANLPYNVVGAGAAAPARALLPVAAARAGHGAGRGRRPARRAGPGSQGLRRAVGQGRLVRRRTPGRRGRPQRVLAGARTSTPAWSPGPAASRRPPPRPASEVFAVVDAAFAQRRKTLRAALRGLGRVRRGGRGGAARRRASTRRARGETLDVEQFARIAEGLADRGSAVERPA